MVDSDYQIDPQFLRRCAPLFGDPKVGFIQAPQDYRDWQGAPFYRRLYYSYHYFFAVSQPSRNERDGAIFAGTMGLIRRHALEQAGGWDEWCITEDAELSLRILRNGWSGLHVDQSFGKGIMPLTFEGLKGQRFRWCFGGIQILRRHWRSLLPGGRGGGRGLNHQENQMTLGADGRSGPQALSLDGATINAAPSPLPLMAGSAAAAAAGDSSAAGELRTRATTLARQDPTYYGDAWVALGPALLEGSITPCSQARA